MPRSKASVLIIESDSPTLELYRRELSHDFNVMACRSEAEALRLSESREISAVILEPALDGGDGWQLFSRLCEALRDRGVPIILCSTQDERMRGMQQGAAAFLVKPVLPIELRETVRRMVS